MRSEYWVDPPSGWMYGFPKKWDGNGEINDWLIQEGYPEPLLNSYGEYFYTRMWYADESSS